MTSNQRDQLQDLLNLDERLSSWEINFIDSLDHLLPLSDKQAEKLNEVWNKHCNQQEQG